MTPTPTPTMDPRAALRVLNTIELARHGSRHVAPSEAMAAFAMEMPEADTRAVLELMRRLAHERHTTETHDPNPTTP